MLSRELAVALRDAGLVWTPENGDRFVVPDRDLDNMVFVLSDMVVEEATLPDGTHVLAFNGTTEWALDALEATEAIGVPSEAQLREPRVRRHVGRASARRRLGRRRVRTSPPGAP